MSKRGNKYYAKKSECHHGHTHDSIKEAKRCNELHLLQMAGEISHLQVQPQFWFVIDGRQIKHDNGRRVGMKPDFQYFKGDQNIVEDCKGFRTSDYVLRKAIFKALFPFITFVET